MSGSDTHIGGKVVLGESGRTGPVFDPPTGEQTHEVDLARRRTRSIAPSRAAAEAFPAWRARRSPSARRSCSGSASCVDLHRADIAKILTAQHGKVLSDAMGEVARGWRTSSSRAACPNLLKAVQREQVRSGVDVLLDPAAARRGRRDHPVQLPGDGAHVDVRERDRVREHVRAEAVGEGPGASLYMAELLKEAGLPTASSTWSGRQGGGRRDPGAPDDRGGELRRFHADRAVHLRDGHQQRASACRRSAARRTT